MEYHWKFRDDAHAKKIAVEGFDFIILDQGDKQFVRTNILQCLYRTQNKSITKQYIRCITTIARFDFPDAWPSLLTDILQYLS